MQLFYIESPIQDNAKQLTFSKEESKHIAKVLRKENGDSFTVTDGKGTKAQVCLTNVTPSACSATIHSLEKTPELPYELHLVVAPTKMNDRLEWLLEKACEIGVSSITPIICKNSERKVIKPERLKKILVSATKQSLQYYIPRLYALQTFKEYCVAKTKTPTTTFIAHCYEDTVFEKTKTPLFQALQNLKEKSSIQEKKRYTILIGPEGDFSKDEVALALEKQYIPISLGTNRLRTETAGICAVHTVAISCQK